MRRGNHVGGTHHGFQSLVKNNCVRIWYFLSVKGGTPASYKQVHWVTQAEVSIGLCSAWGIRVTTQDAATERIHASKASSAAFRISRPPNCTGSVACSHVITPNLTLVISSAVTRMSSSYFPKRSEISKRGRTWERTKASATTNSFAEVKGWCDYNILGRSVSTYTWPILLPSTPPLYRHQTTKIRVVRVLKNSQIWVH